MSAGRAGSWVVYLKALHGQQEPVRAVCEQGEWDALELAQPGVHTLIRAGITNEGEAERLARAGTDGEKPAGWARKPQDPAGAQPPAG